MAQPSHSSIFNSVPHYHSQVPKMMELDMVEILGNVGEIFRKHKVQEELGLVVVHRHFSLYEGEVLVDLPNAERTLSVAHPWKLAEHGESFVLDSPTNGDLLQTHGIFIPIQKHVNIEPVTWAISRDQGTLIPFEFHGIFEDDTETSNGVPPTEFVQDLFRTLQELELLDVFGVRRYASKFWETTEKGARYSVTRYEDPPTDPLLLPKIRKIFWSFGVGEAAGFCENCYDTGYCAHGGS